MRTHRETGHNSQNRTRVLTPRERVLTLEVCDSPRGDGEGLDDGRPRRVWVEPDGGVRDRARGGPVRAAVRARGEMGEGRCHAVSA
ncbi:hypothetical protein GCM10011578_042330 [Streptomyces fuscichromogenes]|uniref:Uncharacterized protein n=1 Tax=Streptomyces fuscichromogenes TaxID=1324013 RepID=A0A917XDX6_9ACTN|nr:hypothetical protein GCM10011578_042330 [Streptomyces fuscichromogenes]